ncbi:MAG: hypothetical protein LBU87_05475 [Lactobacillales bacterium]|jgi:hypothetical protein|nr:hypothetical protein [Lactobacillales bacterium]
MLKQIGICKFCNQEKKLCDAHILPKVFIKDLWDNPCRNKILKIDSFEKRRSTTRIGDIDSRILCEKCDREFGIYDDFAQNFLLKKDLTPYKKIDMENSYFDIPLEEKDAIKLKLFFISFIFRCSISTRPFARGVNLGKKYEELAKGILRSKEDINDSFSIIIIRLSSKDKKTDQIKRQFISSPQRVKFENRNAYSFVMNGFKIIIKTDKLAFKRELQEAQLKKNSILIIEINHDQIFEFKMGVDFFRKTKE